MIRITQEKRRSRLVWLPLVLCSVGGHLGLLFASLEWARSGKVSHGPSEVAFRVQARPRVRRPAPPVPEQEPSKPKPQPLRPKRRLPRPNVEQPESPTPDQPPPRPVFGVTADSVVSGESSVAVRRGNTLAKQMEPKLTMPRWVAPLPDPPRAKAPPKKKAAGPVPIYKLTRSPSFKRKVEPHYPKAARSAGLQGTVILEALIDATGRVGQIRVVRSPSERLARAAMLALRSSSLRPGMVGDRAVPVKLKIPYRFVLDS